MKKNVHTRRTALRTAAGTLTALAGCTGRFVPNTSQTETSVINEVSAEGLSIEVSLHNSANIDSISVISPSGTEFKTQEVASGSTSVVFKVGTEYETGLHEVIATRNGTEIDSTSLEIRPDIHIKQLVVGANAENNVPENLPYAEEQSLLVIENAGTGADSANNLSLAGGVPNPTESDKKRESGIYDSSDGYGAADHVAIPAGTRVRLWSTTKPFLFTGDGVDCKPTSQKHSATVELEFDISGEVARQIEVRYTAAESSDDCSVSIATE